MELRPETWVPGVAPSLSSGAPAACPAHRMTCPAHCPAHCMACPAHCMACGKEQMHVKMHLTIPVSHHRFLHLGTIGISSWTTLCCRGAGLSVVECLPLSASDITKFWQPEMCQTPLEVTALSETHRLRSGSHSRSPLLPQLWSLLANQQMGLFSSTSACFPVPANAL